MGFAPAVPPLGHLPQGVARCPDARPGAAPASALRPFDFPAGNIYSSVCLVPQNSVLSLKIITAMSNNTGNVCNILRMLFSRAVKTNYYD